MGSALSSVRGFRDLLPSESEPTSALEALARERLARYGYREIRVPTLEHQELFVKATGETTDIVEKEMFQLEDQGGRKLALRPEGTPGVVRAYLEHSLNQQGGVTKLFYIGSMFRAERPQKGRYREFEQIGAECLGNPHPAADVEVILALRAVFQAAGLEGKTRLRLNNIGCDASPDCRPRFRAELLAYLKSRAGELCANCQRRIERNPLRALDCKGDGPKLAGAPKLRPCADCRTHFDGVLAMLAVNGFPGLEPDASLVRGLDYYTRTVFEFTASGIGSQDAIAGGGRYDGLVASMGGPDIPAVGWALGVERTIAAASRGPVERPKTAVYVALQAQTNDALSRGARLLEDLRQGGLRADGGLFGSSLKAQLREAERQNAAQVVILGETELKNGRCMLKDMSNGEQREVALDRVVDEVRSTFAGKG